MHPTPLDRPLGRARVRRERAAAIELGLLQGLFVGYLLPWFFLAIGGTMGLANWDSVLAVVVILAWWATRSSRSARRSRPGCCSAMRRHGAARWVNRVPLLWVVVGVALIVWIAVAG